MEASWARHWRESWAMSVSSRIFLCTCKVGEETFYFIVHLRFELFLCTHHTVSLNSKELHSHEALTKQNVHVNKTTRIFLQDTRCIIKQSNHGNYPSCPVWSAAVASSNKWHRTASLVSTCRISLKPSSHIQKGSNSYYCLRQVRTIFKTFVYKTTGTCV